MVEKNCCVQIVHGQRFAQALAQSADYIFFVIVYPRLGSKTLRDVANHFCEDFGVFGNGRESSVQLDETFLTVPLTSRNSQPFSQSTLA